MSNSNINSVVAVVPVNDQSTAVKWYKKLIGRCADLVPVEGVAEWQLAENAWLQVSTDPERAGRTTVVIGVNNIDDQCRACALANVSCGEIVEYPDVIRMIEVTDPDGNKVTFVQDISQRT
ncbi:VOC family protein [Nitrincola lacisaponensis]|uniref:VOC family protein n=1 Tax=Nitrincola lacisaponensis TaxID=267850 RepID=UPI00055A7BFE|nr:VOC family protein [Nitrincola lacisaponensis]